MFNDLVQFKKHGSARAGRLGYTVVQSKSRLEQFGSALLQLRSILGSILTLLGSLLAQLGSVWIQLGSVLKQLGVYTLYSLAPSRQTV